MPQHRFLAMAMLAAIVAGCGTGDPGATPAGPSPAGPSPAGASSTGASTAASQAPATDPSSGGSPGQGTPPDALLSAEGGDPARGQLGSYVWLDGGSDAPWLAGAPITVGAGEPLTVRLEPDEEIVAWRARYVPADRRDPLGARSLGEGMSAPAFPAPDTGSWTAEVSVDFGPDVGSASYFWRLDVR